MRVFSLHRRLTFHTALLVVMTVWPATPHVLGDDEPAAVDADVVYAPMSVDEAKALTDQWLTEVAQADEALREAVAPLWTFESENPSVTVRFDAVLRTFYLADPEVRELVDACLADVPTIVPQQFAALESPNRGEFYLNNLRYFYARYLAVGTGLRRGPGIVWRDRSGTAGRSGGMPVLQGGLRARVAAEGSGADDHRPVAHSHSGVAAALSGRGRVDAGRPGIAGRTVARRGGPRDEGRASSTRPGTQRAARAAGGGTDRRHARRTD